MGGWCRRLGRLRVPPGDWDPRSLVCRRVLIPTRGLTLAFELDGVALPASSSRPASAHSCSCSQPATSRCISARSIALHGTHGRSGYIATLASGGGMDLIVLGLRGRTGSTRTVLGSVTREVLTTAPVLCWSSRAERRVHRRRRDSAEAPGTWQVAIVAQARGLRTVITSIGRALRRCSATLPSRSRGRPPRPSVPMTAKSTRPA